MEKFGRFLLGIINFIINFVIVFVIVFLLFCLITQTQIKTAFQTMALGIENSWHKITGQPPSDSNFYIVGKEQLKQAEPHIYKEEIVIQDNEIKSKRIKYPSKF